MNTTAVCRAVWIVCTAYPISIYFVFNFVCSVTRLWLASPPCPSTSHLSLKLKHCLLTVSLVSSVEWGGDVFLLVLGIF